jgi:hypothetical protein
MKFEQFLQKVDDTFLEYQVSREKVSDVNQWRYGQTVMNVLWDIWPEKYNEIKGTDIDCFYNNAIIRLTLEKLEQDWESK